MKVSAFWQCPNCQSPLSSGPKAMHCHNGHVFDKAKQGYCNLLLANQKAAKEPGDSKEMIEARRAFLNAQHYQPLVEHLAEVLAQHYQGAIDSPVNVLDLGCGEGYYLNALVSKFTKNNVNAYGIDISKVANRRAAGQYKQAEFAVASTFNIPVLNGCVDVALCIFAPLSMNEVKRVLKPETGVLIRVSPGPRHLFQIKQAIYDEVNLHEKPLCPDGFERLSDSRLHYELTLSSEHYRQLITMTPLNWYGKEENKQALLEHHHAMVEIDFDIQLYRLATP